jgi:hypothetical protein
LVGDVWADYLQVAAGEELEGKKNLTPSAPSSHRRGEEKKKSDYGETDRSRGLEAQRAAPPHEMTGIARLLG